MAEEAQGVSVRADEPAARLDVRLIDSFDGTTDVVEWYTQASLLCEYGDVSLAGVLPMRLKGGAFAVWSQLAVEDRRSVNAVRDALFTTFAMDDYAAHTAFVTRRLLPGESVDVYLTSLHQTNNGSDDGASVLSKKDQPMAPVVDLPAETNSDGRGEGSAVRRSERILRDRKSCSVLECQTNWLTMCCVRIVSDAPVRIYCVV